MKSKNFNKLKYLGVLDKLVSVFKLLGIVVSLYCISLNDVFQSPIWLLPVLYTIGLYYCKNNIISNTPGIAVFNILMFVRYVYAPFSYYRTGEVNSMLSNYSHLSDGLYLMIFELIVVFIYLNYSGNQFLNKVIKTKKRTNGELSIYSLNMKYGFILASVIFLILFSIGYNYKSLGQGLNVFTSGQLNDFEEIDNMIGSGEGYVNIIWQSLCVWFYVFLIMQQKKKYDKEINIRSVIFSILYTMAFVLITFIDSTGLTRWYTLITAVSSMFFILYLFPIHKKIIATSILIPLMVVMVFSSLIKNGRYEMGGNLFDSFESTFGATNLDVYCNGLGNVNAVFIAEEKSDDLSILNMPYDVFSSMPVVNRFLSKEYATNAAFHKAVGRKDQIIPMVGQSYLYFGFFLSPLLTVLSIFLFRFFDYKFLFDFSYKKYVYSFSSTWFAVVAMSLNLSIMFMWIYIRILPFYLILALTNRYSQVRKIKSNY